MKKLAIIGAGDLGQQIAYHVAQDNQFEVVGFFDDFAAQGTIVKQIKVLGKLKDVGNYFANKVFDEVIIGIGYKHLAFREDLYNSLKNTIPFATFIHSSCYVDASCSIGKGVCIFPGTVIDQQVTIKDDVFINVSCTIAHDSTIDRHTFLSPRVAIAGFVNIGKRCSIGVNSTVIDNINIADDVQIGGGTVVIKQIEKSGLYVGNPSRFIR
ncbi:acetyltransferase [Flavivirga amylovorans]|uniref:Acetyltransferase n=1 Tax=Flavivirga amylovorans TaxID=870486 RepID=A0ABT8WXK4_9FLAO|nr:acetyltransferase [Flavivirga amylovorans]MDO5986390.1 acetyltransferase [Flavivirga amylovorans]